MKGAIRETTTGIPLAIASSTQRPKPSLTEGEDKRGGQRDRAPACRHRRQGRAAKRPRPLPAVAVSSPAESGLIGMMIEQARAACDDEARVGLGAMNLDEGLKNADRVLARLDAADRRETPGLTPRPRRCAKLRFRSVEHEENIGKRRRRCRRPRLRVRSARRGSRARARSRPSRRPLRGSIASAAGRDAGRRNRRCDAPCERRRGSSPRCFSVASALAPIPSWA